MSDTTAPSRAEPRAFTSVLTDIRNGSLVNELTEKLADVAQGVELHGKKGELTLKLQIVPVAGGVSIADTLTCKVPDYDRPAAFFYVGGEGALSRSPLNQDPLPFDGADR